MQKTNDSDWQQLLETNRFLKLLNKFFANIICAKLSTIIRRDFNITFNLIFM